MLSLETHKGKIAEPVTSGGIARAVARLAEVGEAYIILGDAADRETYVQAAGTVGEDFIIERRDGCAGEHYRGDRRVTSVELVTMLVAYLQGVTTWSHVISWHRVCVDFDTPSAMA